MAALARLSELTKATVNDGILEGYADHLEVVKDEALCHAFEQAEKRCRFLPTIPELLEFATEWNPEPAARSKTAVEQRRELERERSEHPERFLSEEEDRALWQELGQMAGCDPEKLRNGDSDRELRQRNRKASE